MKSIFFVLLLFHLTGQLEAQTERIPIKVPKLYPEGVAWSPGANSFFISSARMGTIGKLTKAGAYEVFYKDSSLKSTFGMKADDKSGLLWVAAGDPNYSLFSTLLTFHKMARILAIDLTTGVKKADIDLSGLYQGEHFINDLTLDDKGNLYATDSYSPVIYKVTKDGKASIFSTSPLFAGKDVALNGIVFHPGGYLIIANDATGNLLKVDTKNPSQPVIIKTGGFFPGADGLLLDSKLNLILVQNKGIDKIYQFSSKDNWLSAAVVASTATEDRFQNPSTVAAAGYDLYALNSKLNELSDSIKAPSKEFSLQRVVLK